MNNYFLDLKFGIFHKVTKVKISFKITYLKKFDSDNNTNKYSCLNFILGSGSGLFGALARQLGDA